MPPDATPSFGDEGSPRLEVVRGESQAPATTADSAGTGQASATETGADPVTGGSIDRSAAPPMTVRTPATTPTDDGDRAGGREASATANAGADPSMGSATSTAARTEPPTTTDSPAADDASAGPPLTARQIDRLVDTDRFVDRLYRSLERRKRIERERRGR